MFYVASARCWYRAAGDCSGRARRGDAGRTNWLQHNLSTTPDGETSDVPVQDMAQTGYNTTSPLLQMGRLLMSRYKTWHKLATTQSLHYLSMRFGCCLLRGASVVISYTAENLLVQLEPNVATQTRKPCRPATLLHRTQPGHCLRYYNLHNVKKGFHNNKQ